MGINAALKCQIVCAKPRFVDKKMYEKRNKFGQLSPKEIQELRTIPSQKQRKGDVAQTENIQWYVSFKFPVESCKISNMNIEILRLHEDYVTTTIFT